MFLLQKSKEFHPLYSCPKFKSLSVSESVGFVKANHLCFKCFSPNCTVKSCRAKDCFCKKPHNRLIHFSKPDNKSPSQILEGSVLNPLADVFGGSEESDCVVSPQGENEENKSFVATSFLKNKKRTVLLSSILCLLRDRFGVLHQNTVFGYVVSGSAVEARNNNIHGRLIRDSDLNTTLMSFFELESISVQNENCSSEEDISLEMFKQRVHFKNGNEMTVRMVYRFNRVLFSLNASPFLLAATIKTHIGKYMEKYPDIVRTLDHCFYVDDLITGEDDAKSAFDLSSTAKYDRKTDWDEELLPDIREKFEQWCSEASFLCELQIPRYALGCDSVICPECEIHKFSDASIKAYEAVSYVRLRTFDKISVHLLASKSRVAPLKVLTLPRFELMGALLAARLAKNASRVLSEKISITNYFWTDLTIALSWIQGPSNRWKVFVANRVKEIRSLTDKDSWRHCPGKDNPSDLLTRCISADSLINCEKWWKGLSFLQEGNTVPVSNNVLLRDERAYLEELNPS
ncbi:integrase_H2C2 domain-containing protein [Trichonephila clavipes]|nr:integrase_H2C2 domain-containing protein [Trichonephila clavipes]